MNFTLGNRTSFFIILLLSLLLFGNTLSGGFVWDDHYLIEYNPRMKDVSAVPDFFAKDFWENSSLNFKSGFYRPLTLLAFFADYHLWKGEHFGFHLFNVIL